MTSFKAAVEATPSVADAWRAGLAALRERDRSRIQAEDTRRLRGSVNVEAALDRIRHPSSKRWDYAIGHQPSNVESEMVFWIEIHPANSAEINVVLDKLESLMAWLRDSAPALDALHREFIWISSGKTSLSLSAPQKKRFAKVGLQHRGRLCRIPNNVIT